MTKGFRKEFVIACSLILSASAIGAMTFSPSIEYVVVGIVAVAYSLVIIVALASRTLAARILVVPTDRATLVWSLLLALVISLACFYFARKSVMESEMSAQLSLCLSSPEKWKTQFGLIRS